MPPRLPHFLRQHLRRNRLRRPFHRTHMTEDQVKTAELQKTPHTPNNIATEVPHSKESSLVYDVPSPLWYHRMGPVKDFFSWFSRAQRRRPLTVAVGTSITTYFCGDIVAQEISGEPYDYKRTARMLLVGGVASLPGYRWFMFLGSHFNYGSAVASIGLKVLIQQMVFAPVFNTYFFGMQALLSGETMHGVIHRVQAAVPESILSSAKFWPAVTALNFTLIPAHLRFAFSGVFAVVWQTYLSFLNKRKEERHMKDVHLGWTGLAEGAKDRAGERMDEHGITDLVEDVKGKVGDAVDDMKVKTGDVVGDVRDRVGGAMDDAREKVQDAREKASDAVQDVKSKVSDMVDDAKDKVSGVFGTEADGDNDRRENRVLEESEKQIPAKGGSENDRKSSK